MPRTAMIWWSIPDALALGSNERVDLIFDRIAETGKRLNVPVLIGEWGALYGQSPDLIPVAAHIMGEFNRHGFSDTFWAYGKFLDEASFLGVLQKSYPMSVSGKLTDYSFDRTQGAFVCHWQDAADAQGSTKIFVPNLNLVDKESIELSPASDHIDLEAIEGSKAGYLIIAPSGKTMQKSLKFRMRNTNSPEVSLGK